MVDQTSQPEVISSHTPVQANTVRSQLKSIFIKTETRGQADLVRLLLSTAGRID